MTNPRPGKTLRPRAWRAMRRVVLAILLMPLAQGRVMHADGVTGVTLEVSVGDDDHAAGGAVRHVFGGAPLRFRATVEAPLGTRLSLRADLVQTTAGGVAATLLKDVPVSVELPFDGRTFLTADCTLPEVPAVARPTPMRLFLRAVAGDQSAPMPPTPVDLFVYPPEKPGEWKKMIAAALATSGSGRLEVFGKGKTLRQFLRDRRVDFEDGGEEWPAEIRPRTVYVADTPLPVPARFASAVGLRLTLILPPSDSPLLPGIYQSVDPQGGCLTRAMLPDLLDRLPDDPRSQQTLAEIFRLALAPRTPRSPAEPEPDPSP